MINSTIIMKLQNYNLSLQIARKCLKFTLKYTKMRWRLGLRPRTRWGSSKRSPRPPCRRGKVHRNSKSPLFKNPPPPWPNPRSATVHHHHTEPALPRSHILHPRQRQGRVGSICIALRLDGWYRRVKHVPLYLRTLGHVKRVCGCNVVVKVVNISKLETRIYASWQGCVMT